jgi:predicted lipoprotein with Yx(FWY)xxD motif
VDAGLVGSFRRPDGKVQAMYNGWPLYSFADDYVAGDVNGHDFEEFGGE